VGVVDDFATDEGEFVGTFAGGVTCFVVGVLAGAAGVGAGVVAATGPGDAEESEPDEETGTGVSVVRLHPLKAKRTDAITQICTTDTDLTGSPFPAPP